MLEEDLNYILSVDVGWESFANKTILITGANGFLPAYMVETLLLLNNELLKEYPCKVIALVRNIEHTKQRFINYLDNNFFRIIVQDVVKDINISEKIDYIVHAASPASPKYYNIDPVGVILPNILGTKNTLELAIKNKIDGYLYFSSGEVYGELENNETIKEDNYGFLDPMTVRACYGESKRMGENLCISYGHQYNIPVKIVRPFHTYGPGMKLNDGRVFADFVENIVNNMDIELKSNGSAIRPFCYIADATIAFFIVLLHGKTNSAYNVSNPEESISIKELALKLVKLFPEKELNVIFTKQSNNYMQSKIKRQLPDISKLTQMNWKPTISIEDGFKKTIESYIQNKENR